MLDHRPREPRDNEERKLKEEYERAHKKVSSLVEMTHGINTEWVTFLLYLSSENLTKQSKTLSKWTIVIGIATILLFISAVIQILTLCFG